jgi:alpha-tubulin suppressor-like RCC1 family protein
MTTANSGSSLRSALLLLGTASLLGGCVNLLDVSCTSDDDCAVGVCNAGVCSEASDTGGGDGGEGDAGDAGDAGDTTDGDTLVDTGDAATDGGDVGDAGGDTVDDADATDVGGDTDGGCAVENVCGGCAELDGDIGDACGPCELDQLRCEGVDALVCTGSTECGDTAFDIVGAAPLSVSSLHVEGNILAIGDTPPTGHGFCVGPNPSPALGVADSVCVPLGAADVEGPFSATVAELDVGTQYYVRAFVVTVDATRYSRALETWTLPTAPAPVEATDGTLEAQVLVSWPAVDRATGYRVSRDGEVVAELDTTYFLDEIDVADLVPSADGLELTASQGTREDGVEVAWAEPTVPAPSRYEYTVTAINPGGESAPSNTAEGAAAAVPITGYELTVGDETIEVEGTSFFDAAAPFGAILPIGVVASDGTSAEFVSLSLVGLDEVEAGAVEYSVRAVNASGVGAAATASGFRGLAEPALSWEWAASVDEGYNSLAGATTPTAIDISASGDGSPRLYRLCVTMPSVERVCSAPDAGFRAVGVPTITTAGPFEATGLGARFEAQVTSDTAPAVAEIGLTWSTEPDPSPAEGDSHADGGAATIPDTFSHTIAGLEPGTTIYVRAYVRFGVPTPQYYFGQNVEFATIPAPPTNVRASDGTSSSVVTVQWDAASGADSYDVYRDGELIGTSSSRLFDDADAAPALPPAGEALAPVATQGVFGDLVRVSWSPPPTNGVVQPASYTVRAVNARGTSDPSAADSGWRASAGNLRYEVDIDGTHRTTVLGLRLDDRDAPPPSVRWTEFTATDEASAYYVDLNATASLVEGAASTYRVRVISDDGEGTFSSTVTGWRGPTDVEAWVEREIEAVGDGPDYWEMIESLATTGPYRYSGPVDDGTGSYRAGAMVGGAGPYYSDPDSGGRAKHAAVEQIVAGTSHYCALFEGGTVRCWGDNAFGQLGYGDTLDRGANVMQLPTPALELGDEALMIAAGNDHTCALLASESIVCWGRGRYGRLGSGSEDNLGDERGEMPPAAIDLGGRATAVFAGGQNTCAVVDGRLGCWGYNENAQLGFAPVGGDIALGDERGEMPPTFSVTSGWVDSMNIGATHMCAIFHGAYDEVWCWGSATNGAIGPPDAISIGNPYRPRTVTAGSPSSLSGLVGGAGFNCILSTAGLGCWGENEFGQLGAGNTSDYGDSSLELIPTLCDAFDSATFAGAGRQHACALGRRGEVACWGHGAAGQLGNGGTEAIGDESDEVPVTAFALPGDGVMLTGAALSTCAVTVENDVYCWGSNAAGQLANGHVGPLGDEAGEMPPSVSWIQ